MLPLDPQMLWETDEVWVDVIMVLDLGTVRFGWMLLWVWPMDAVGNG